jgi:stress response protein YsnF
MSEARPDPDEIAVPLRAEELVISRRKVEGDVVRVATVTREREHQIDEELRHHRVEITRVPIGRRVDSAPPVREEGDVTIMSVLEEIVIVERQLILKEEIHIRQVRTTEKYRELVVLREQDAMISRGEAESLADGKPAQSS